MRRTVVIASTVVAAAAAAVTVSAAQASSDARTRDSLPGAASRAATQITVVEHAVTDTTVDTGSTGDSVGDLLPFANPVFNKNNTNKVGRDQGSCIRTVVGKAWQCSWTTFLPKGSLVVEGPFYDTHDSVLAITGGTGAYSQARGTMLLHARNATTIVFRFNVKS